ncbi:anti-sigma-D factor RsdA [Tsukamurella pseudospumae]|uniref:Anti-sigma-D factor RsdA sigma factor binding region domain-containing protein n=1 Tax=Tsukamurella pseudospumae TaxID=239498 RepID=A0A137ZDU2_9ACTN|nr:anti-sigma-D factor RsdA [Tsukamurella pseudospumae]KXO96358.1 hypothetical protein AXK61_22875 [Tsukamurella pseudospumae]
MADDTNKPGNNQGRFDPQDPERTATHRLGPPMRPMRPGGPRDFRDGDTGFVDRVTDDGAPVDVAAVRRDDDLIEALAAGGAVTTADQTEFTLASLLADWRDEIVTTPVPSGPSIDEIVAATGGGRRGRGMRSARPTRPVPPPPAPLVGGTPDGAPEAPSGDGDVTDIANAPSRRNRRFGLIAGSAAAAVAIIGGGGVLVNSADPGDGALWSVKEVVFSDAASQTVATSEAKAQIAKADEEISGSNQAAAQTALVSARQQAAKVKNAKDRAALEERIRAAEARAGLPVGSTDLPTSAPSTPSAPPTSPSTVPTTPPTTVPYPTILDTPVPTTRPTTPRPTPTTTRPTTTEPTTTEPTTTEPTTTATTVTTTTPPATTTTTPPPRTTSTSRAAATETTTVLPPELFPR